MYFSDVELPDTHYELTPNINNTAQITSFTSSQYEP